MGGQDPTCSFINKGRDCSWEEAGCVFSHTSPLTLTRVQGRLTEAQGPEVVRAPPGGHPRAGPQWHTQAAPGAPAWASETEDRETRRNSFSPWAVNDTDSRGGWESGEGSKGSEDRGCSRGRAVCGWTPSGWTTSQGDGGRKVLGGGGTFHVPSDISWGGGGASACSMEAQADELREESGEGVGPLWAEGAAGTWQWGGERKWGAQGDPEFQAAGGMACGGRGAPGAGQLSPWTVPAAQTPFLPEACKAAGPGLSTCAPWNWGAPPVPGAEQLPSAGQPSLSTGPGLNTGLHPNMGLEQRGPGVGGPLPLARGALLRPQRRHFLLCRPRG